MIGQSLFCKIVKEVKQMEKDFGLRFTDETYATKDDVKRALNISSIDSIWDKITQFRSYYTKQIIKNYNKPYYCKYAS